MTTGKYELVIKWPSGQSTICVEMTDHQHGEICRILSPDYRAQVSQGGEAVAWRVPVREGGKRTSFYTEVLPFVPGIGVAVLGDPVPLYTHPADQVAEGVRADAERYRFLMRELGGSVAQVVMGSPVFSDEDVAAAIDAALSAKP